MSKSILWALRAHSRCTFFDGPFDNRNPAGWSNGEDLVGMHGFFTGPEAQGDGIALVNAGISITGALLKDVQGGRLSDMGMMQSVRI